MSDEIEVLALEIKVTHLVVSCSHYCSFCQKCQDLSGHYPFCFAECVPSTYEAAVWKQWFGRAGRTAS